jgi:hypothetical protein
MKQSEALVVTINEKIVADDEENDEVEYED